jgi:mannose-6-phosphate isomerase-like protein (cupin superfamily)
MSSHKFIVKGQGVFIFENHDPYIKFQIHNCKDHKQHLEFEITETSVVMYRNSVTYKDPNNKKGINTLNGAYYWVSINSQTQQIYLGIGEPRLETMIYQYLFDHSEKPFLESLSHFRYISVTNHDSHLRFDVLKDPITRQVPLFVKDTNQLTMTDIAKGTYLSKANLSLTSQKLYDCISGKRFVLDDDDFPQFSDAIEQSIITPGLWCYQKLQSKSREFNPDKPNLLETYLRITLGENNGESPGVPYVMEIWPSQHYSPIHSHASASAVIRVLYGTIHVRLYPFLCAEKEGVDPFGTVDFKEGDITWISPTLNQTHQLINNGNKTCVTIQCYMYESDNNRHYDYFDYLDEDGDKKKYEPDSDMDYIAFRELMKTEWEQTHV